MQTTEHGWTIIDADAGVLSYTYHFAPGASANCFTARLDSGGLMVLSPPSKIPADHIDDLLSYGSVEALVANNGFHHLGLATWRERFPDARCFAAPGAQARIAKKSKTAGQLEPLSALQLLLADGVEIIETSSSRCGETWARARLSDGSYAWYASDLLVNMDSLPSNFVVRQMFKWTKSAPGYRPFNLAQRLILKDRKAVMRAMLEDVREHPPRVMVPGHGALLASDSLAEDTERLLASAAG